MLNNPGGAVLLDVPGVSETNIRFVFQIIAFMNEEFRLKESRAAILRQPWPLSRGTNLLRTVKLEMLCGDLRKYGGKRKTIIQWNQ